MNKSAVDRDAIARWLELFALKLCSICRRCHKLLVHLDNEITEMMSLIFFHYNRDELLIEKMKTERHSLDCDVVIRLGRPF